MRKVITSLVVVCLAILSLSSLHAQSSADLLQILKKYLVTNDASDRNNDKVTNLLDFAWIINLLTQPVTPVTPPDASPTATPVVTNPATSCPAGKSLSFQDSFDGTSLNTTKWDTCIKQTVVNGTFLNWTCRQETELNYYKKDNISVANGLLTLTAKKEPFSYTEYGQTSNFAYTSGAINTSPTFNFYGGYMEARVKIPKGRGLWPAFWSICKTDVPWDVCWPKNGEIDILEVLGQEPNILHTTQHYGVNNTYVDGNLGQAHTLTDLSLGFHTYAADWTNSTITWYYDGQKIYQTPNYIPTTSDVISTGQNKHYLIFNLAVGGWAGAPDSSTIFPATMQVDYVKVCQ